MSYRVEKWRVEACDSCMESGLDKGIRADINGAMTAALEHFEMALEYMPECAQILECCAMLKFMLDDKSKAREFRIRASRNQHCFVSETTARVHRLVWIEFMKRNIYRPLIGKQMGVECNETLPALPPRFESNWRLQVFRGEFHFSPAIERVGDEVAVTLTLEHAEIGVSNFLVASNFQGYFLSAYDIDVSSSDNLKPYSRLSTVRPVVWQNPQLVQQQLTTGYAAQVGIGGGSAIPVVNVAYNSSEAISTFTPPEGMTASRAPGDEKVMRSTWKVNTYEKGKPVALKPVRKIRRLPYSPTKHVCTNSVKFQGK